MFSNPQLASFINETFEPTWQSVRKVPIITIDMGNGKRIKRTLNGNVASYVCDSVGSVIDVLPGLYSPEAYEDRLNQLRLLNAHIQSKPKELRARTLVAYHEIQKERLKKGESPLRFSSNSKSLVPNIGLSPEEVDPNKNWTRPLDRMAFIAKPIPKQDLSRWQMLTDDVRLNETINRRKIHERLADESCVAISPSFSSLTHWIYRDVLHADLDDPYFGIGEILSKNYPFESSGI